MTAHRNVGVPGDGLCLCGAKPTSGDDITEWFEQHARFHIRYLTPAERDVVARFDAAPPLPEMDEQRVQRLAEDLLWTLDGRSWGQLDPEHQPLWLDLARHALTIPGVRP